MDYQLGFAIVVESGDLEQKAVLLVESIREYAGPLKHSPIWAIQPRLGSRISQETINTFADRNVFYIFADLNREWLNYPIANKIYAASLVETLASNLQTLCFLDTDLLCLQPPEQLVLSETIDLAIRPVDKRGVGLTIDQHINSYWQFCFEICGCTYDDWWEVGTTVEQILIRAYFNSGLIAVRPQKRIFRMWKDAIVRAWHHEKRNQLSKQQQHNLDQSLLTAIIIGTTPRERIQLLSPEYNYPLHNHKSLPNDIRASCLDDIIFAHYHRIFYSSNWWKYIEIGEEMNVWLRNFLPLNYSLRNRIVDMVRKSPLSKLSILKSLVRA